MQSATELPKIPNHLGEHQPSRATRTLLTARLINEERAILTHQQAQQPNVNTSFTANIDALYSHSNQTQRGRLGRRDSDRSSNRPRHLQGDLPRCTYSTLPGHKVEVCRTNKRDERIANRHGSSDRANMA